MRARTFSLAVDGHNYWVKVRAQQGLVAELICGRLGHLLGVAPNAAIIRIIKEVVVSHQTAGDLVGILAGTVDVVGTINPKDMGRIAPELKLDEKNVDALSRANVVIFQTWIGAGDPQVLIDPGTGKVLSIDHGGALADTTNQGAPTLVVAPIPGLPDTYGSKAGARFELVERIESLSEEEILEAVSRVPTGEEVWRGSRTTRLTIGRWLASRRSKVREVIEKWQ